jgi:hypothetical protein
MEETACRGGMPDSTKEIHYCLGKRSRGVGVDPMSGFGNRDEPGLGEEMPDRVEVAVEDMIRTAAADEEGGSRGWAFAFDGKSQFVVVTGDGVEVEFPAEASVVVGGEVFEQELAEGGLRDVPGKGGINLVPAFEGGEIEPAKRGEDPPVVGREGLGRHVGDDELPELIRMAEGEEHGNLASHGMAEDIRSRKAVGLKEFEDVRRHEIVIERVAVRGAAVVAEVESEDLAEGGEPAADPGPIVERPEEPMQDEERRTCSGGLEVQLHARRAVLKRPCMKTVFYRTPQPLFFVGVMCVNSRVGLRVIG